MKKQRKYWDLRMSNKVISLAEYKRLKKEKEKLENIFHMIDNIN
jgi:hypothetical protein